jgi:hypothetical protein
MAVTQIAKIQVRRGLSQDLGLLASGEIAWAIDTQRLYIGNGTFEEGAPISGKTEIITSNYTGNIDQVLGLYTYKGAEGGYQVVTGIDANNDITRSYQNKIDDFVNLRDYGAVGNGLVDDSRAIQRCIDETYNRQQIDTAPRTRRAIRCSAGVYRLSRELRIPPYAVFIAEGSATFLQVGPEANCVARLTTSAGEDPAGVVTGNYPDQIVFHGVGFESDRDIDLLHIDGATNCRFESVSFVGPNFADNTDGTVLGAAGVHISSSASTTNKITFSGCRFSGLTYAAFVDADVETSEILFDDCKFVDLFQTVHVIAGQVAPRGVRITNSRIENIFSSAIYGGMGVSGIVSAFNTYINVGNQGGDDTTPVVPVILFQADNNYSIADVFSRAFLPTADTQVPRVHADGYAVISTALDDAFRLGNSHQRPGKKFQATAGQITVFPYVSIPHGIINYSVTRDGSVRSGVIKFAAETNGIINYDDEYVESVDLGVTMGFDQQPGDSFFSLRAAVTGGGSDADITFDIKTLN